MQAAGDVVISRKGEARVERGHPWIFRSDVVRAEGVEPGAVVRVLGTRLGPMGYAFWSDRSEIRLRLIERGAALSPSWLTERLRAAIAWRRTVAKDAMALRLVHGEGDGLPSLVVDRYGPYLVIQTLSQATDRLKPQIVERLVSELRPEGIFERNDPRVRLLEGLEQRTGLLHGSVPGTVVVDEGGVRFEADLIHGQKTGLFLDQRENHLMARSYARGRVLDAFTYNGGFALHVASVADSVLALDVSEEAVARVRHNAELNAVSNVETRAGNAFDVLHDLVKAGERFDTVILDPPAFAKSRDAVEKAVRGYKEINLRALSLLRPGGILITCSCSYHVHEDDLEGILASAAADAGVTATIVEKRRQGRDHPVVLGVPETYYLKCFVLRRLA